jgi:hypothetical protein
MRSTLISMAMTVGLGSSAFAHTGVGQATTFVWDIASLFTKRAPSSLCPLSDCGCARWWPRAAQSDEITLGSRVIPTRTRESI